MRIIALFSEREKGVQPRRNMLGLPVRLEKMNCRAGSSDKSKPP